MASTTDMYKEHIQKIVYDELGVKVSKDKAWKLFKAGVLGTVQFVEELEGNKMSLAGIGSFQIQKTKARGSKADAGWEFVPRFKFRPSSVVTAGIEKYFGLGDHDDIQSQDYGIFRNAAEVEEEAAPAEEIPAACPTEAAPAEDDFFNL